MPLKKRERVPVINRWFIVALLLGFGFAALMIRSLIGLSPDSLREQLRPAVLAVLDHRKRNGRLPANLGDVGLIRETRISYDPGWDHRLKREVFTLGGGGRPRVVWYDSERGWFTNQEGPSTPFAPVEP